MRTLQVQTEVNTNYVNQHYVVKQDKFGIGNIKVWNDLISRYPQIIKEAGLVAYEGGPDNQVWFLYPKNKPLLEKIFVKYNKLRRLDMARTRTNKPGPKVGSKWKWSKKMKEAND